MNYNYLFKFKNKIKFNNKNLFIHVLFLNSVILLAIILKIFSKYGLDVPLEIIGLLSVMIILIIAVSIFVEILWLLIIKIIVRRFIDVSNFSRNAIIKLICLSYMINFTLLLIFYLVISIFSFNDINYGVIFFNILKKVKVIRITSEYIISYFTIEPNIFKVTVIITLNWVVPLIISDLLEELFKLFVQYQV